MLAVVIIVAIVLYARAKPDKKYGFDMRLPGPGDPSPTIFNHKRYKTLEDWESDLTVVWNGPARIVEFTYETYDFKTKESKKARRKVEVRQILENSSGEYYLRGHCYVRKDTRTFNAQCISTKILDKSYRYEVMDWIASRT